MVAQGIVHKGDGWEAMADGAWLAGGILDVGQDDPIDQGSAGCEISFMGNGPNQLLPDLAWHEAVPNGDGDVLGGYMRKREQAWRVLMASSARAGRRCVLALAAEDHSTIMA